MHDPVQVQDIFHFDRQNELVGRTFPESVNIMNVSFAPAPRKPGQLRLTLCPMVRATREKLQLVGDDQQVGLKFVTPETLYDLNFSVDIPVDSFLIVTPSPDAQRLTSMGNAFFIKETPSERQEQIMLVMPWPHEVQKRVASAKK
jgi:hypothetical protein